MKRWFLKTVVAAACITGTVAPTVVHAADTYTQTHYQIGRAHV